MRKPARMVRGYLFFLIIVGVLASMLSNCGSRTSSSSTPGIDRPVERQEQAMTMSTSDTPSLPSDALELRREADGHFYADVEINGQNVRILVDTGASGIALSRDDARRAGLAVSIGMNTVVGQGASGDVRGEYVQLDRIKLGSTEVEKASAVILDSGSQSLLGQSFLSRFASVEIRGDRMILR